MILYALTNGFLDDIPVEDILRFEEESLYGWLDHNRAELLEEISTTGKLPAEEKLADALNTFKRTFAKCE